MCGPKATAAETVGALIAARLAEVLTEAGDDDTKLVRLCAAELTYSAAYQAQVEEIRDAAVARLREAGMPLTRISLYAGVSDSYLSRRLRGRF